MCILDDSLAEFAMPTNTDPVYMPEPDDGGCLPVAVSKLAKYHDIAPPIRRHWVSAIQAAKDEAVQTLREVQKDFPTTDMTMEESLLTLSDFGDWDAGRFSHTVVEHLFKFTGQMRTVKVCRFDIINDSHEPFLVYGVINPGYFFNMNAVPSDMVYSVAVVDKRVHSTFTNHRGKRITIPVAHLFNGGLFKSITDAYYVISS